MSDMVSFSKHFSLHEFLRSCGLSRPRDDEGSADYVLLSQARTACWVKCSFVFDNGVCNVSLACPSLIAGLRDASCPSEHGSRWSLSSLFGPDPCVTQTGHDSLMRAT